MAAQAAAVQAAQQANETPAPAFSFFPNINPIMQPPASTQAEVTEITTQPKPTIAS